MKKTIIYIALSTFLLQTLPAWGWVGDAMRPVNLIEVDGGEIYEEFKTSFPYAAYQTAAPPTASAQNNLARASATAENLYRIDGVECNLQHKGGYHVAPSYNVASEVFDIYEKTGIKVMLSREGEEKFIFFKPIEIVVNAIRSDKRFEDLDIEEINALALIQIKPEEYDNLFETEKLNMCQTYYKLELLGLGIVLGDKYDILVEGPYSKEILKMVAEYIRDYSREELLLEPQLARVQDEEFQRLYEKYYDRLDEIIEIAQKSRGTDRTSAAEIISMLSSPKPFHGVRYFESGVEGERMVLPGA